MKDSLYLNFSDNMKLALQTIMLVCLSSMPAASQMSMQVVTLDSCLYYGTKNLPIVRQKLMLEAASGHNLENIRRMVWPQVSVQGQATIQSEVTGIPISFPNVEIPTLSKDQYRLYGEVNQSITDFFTVQDVKQVSLQQYAMDQQKLEVETFKWEEKIVDLFFQIALIQSQEEQIVIMKNDLDAGIQKLRSAVDNGVALPSSLDQLLAEKVKIEQKEIELNHARLGLTASLETWMGKSVSPEATWQLPAPILSPESRIRPEIALLAEQQKMTDAQAQMLDNKQLPRLGAFFQLGAGRPGLNMLSNDFDMYWIGGVRLQWNLSTWYTLAREKKILTIQRDILENQKDHVGLQMAAAESQMAAEIRRFTNLVEKDNELLVLREKIQASAASQLENGTITAQDYLTFVGQSDLARQSLAAHKIQWLKMQYLDYYLKGNKLTQNK